MAKGSGYIFVNLVAAPLPLLHTNRDTQTHRHTRDKHTNQHGNGTCIKLLSIIK